MGSRVTVALRGGGALRVALPFAPVRPLPALALDVLAEALPPPAWHAFHSRYLVSQGDRWALPWTLDCQCPSCQPCPKEVGQSPCYKHQVLWVVLELTMVV